MLQLNLLPSDVFILTLLLKTFKTFKKCFVDIVLLCLILLLKPAFFRKRLDRKVAILKQDGENISIIPGNDSSKVKPAMMHFWRAIGSEKIL